MNNPSMTSRKRLLPSRFIYFVLCCAVWLLILPVPARTAGQDRTLPLSTKSSAALTDDNCPDGPDTTDKQPDGWTVKSVPHPKKTDANNWVCNPDGILSWEAERTLNSLLQQLEDSLSIEVAVVALQSIADNHPQEFALSLFNYWGVGKASDHNGLLILLTRDIRDITFRTGYGLEGVLPDAICKRIQLQTMVPYLRQNDWDNGMIEGVKALTATLYQSDYQPAPPESWWKHWFNTTPGSVWMVWALLLLLINVMIGGSFVKFMTPADRSTEAVLALRAKQKPFTMQTLLRLCWIFPVWPALLYIFLWYRKFQQPRLLRKSRTCPECQQETLHEMPLDSLPSDTALLTGLDRKELKLKTVCLRLYHCNNCGKDIKIRIPLHCNQYECCPDCHGMTLHQEEVYRTVKQPTSISEGLREARHCCRYCGATYMVTHIIPRIRQSATHSSGGGSGSGGGSFGGGRSGGGGSSTRF